MMLRSRESSSFHELDRPSDRPRNLCRVETCVERGNSPLQQVVDSSNFTLQIGRCQRKSRWLQFGWLRRNVADFLGHVVDPFLAGRISDPLGVAYRLRFRITAQLLQALAYLSVDAVALLPRTVARGATLARPL